MSRPDVVNVKDEGQKFKPHPEGQYAAVCVDVVDLGERLKTYAGKKPHVAREVAIVFWTGEVNEETGNQHEVSAKMTISMGPKANLRSTLESWRGKGYTPAEAEAGVPLHKLVGCPALISVEQKESGSGRKYAVLRSIAPLPKAMQPPDLPTYDRPDFWEERKKENAEEVRKFKADSVKVATPVTTESFDDFPEALDAEDDDSDLPF